MSYLDPVEALPPDFPLKQRSEGFALAERLLADRGLNEAGQILIAAVHYLFCLDDMARGQ